MSAALTYDTHHFKRYVQYTYNTLRTQPWKIHNIGCYTPTSFGRGGDARSVIKCMLPTSSGGGRDVQYVQDILRGLCMTCLMRATALASLHASPVRPSGLPSGRESQVTRMHPVIKAATTPAIVP